MKFSAQIQSFRARLLLLLALMLGLTLGVQYYFNLRASQTSRTDALTTLKARYGSKS